MGTNGKQKSAARHYALLKPEERLPLIVAAGLRGDEEERESLIRSSPRVVLEMPEHTGIARAFADLSWLMYAEVVEWAAAHHDAIAYNAADDAAEDERRKTLLIGYIVLTYLRGWILFCRRVRLPPFALWKTLAGWDRLRTELRFTKKFAFVRIGYERYVRERLPEGCPPDWQPALTPDAIARELADHYESSAWSC